MGIQETLYIKIQLMILLGFLYSKDLLGHLNKKNFKWQQLLREPFFIPENKN